QGWPQARHRSGARSPCLDAVAMPSGGIEPCAGSRLSPHASRMRAGKTMASSRRRLVPRTHAAKRNAIRGPAHQASPRLRSADDDARADADAVVEVDDVLVQHADAAGGHGPPDRVRLVRAVDAVER